MAALDAALSVTTLLPLPGAAIVKRERVAVIPAGNPERDNARGELNPTAAAVVMVMAMDPPGLMLTEVLLNRRANVGATRVRAMGCVCVTPPPVAVTRRL